MAEEEKQSAFKATMRSVVDSSKKTKAQQVLGELIVRSGLVFDVNELDAANGQYAQAVWESHKQIVLAAISSHIAIFEDNDGNADQDAKPLKTGKPLRPKDRLETADFKLRAYRDDCVLCEAAPNYDRSSWLKVRERELEVALKPPTGFVKPQIICFGELAYPPPAAVDFATGVDYVSQFGRRQVQFESRMRQVCEDYAPGVDPFLFLGSYHCPITLYNVGMVMPRGMRGYGPMDMQVTARRLQRDKEPYHVRNTTPISLPISHRKRFPAKRASEQTRVPPDNQFRVFATPIGRVAILICSDIVDMNQFLFIARYNDSMIKVDRIDYVLVPSYNTSQSLVDMCRQLSEIAATTVLLVNANADDDEKGFPATSIHCCGETLSSDEADTEVPADGSARKLPVFVKVTARNVEHLPDDGSPKRMSRITWFRFDTKAFQEFVNERSDAIKTELGLATNAKPAPVV